MRAAARAVAVAWMLVLAFGCSSPAKTEDGALRSGRLWRLLGVFSSMPVAGERETNLQLGYVWKAALIADLARTYRAKTAGTR